MQTSIYKDHHGWNGETISKNWRITTLKRYNKDIVSVFTKGEAIQSELGKYIGFSTDFDQMNEAVELYRSKLSRVTESKIKEIHDLALKTAKEKGLMS